MHAFRLVIPSITLLCAASAGAADLGMGPLQYGADDNHWQPRRGPYAARARQQDAMTTGSVVLTSGPTADEYQIDDLTISGQGLVLRAPNYSTPVDEQSIAFAATIGTRRGLFIASIGPVIGLVGANFDEEDGFAATYRSMRFGALGEMGVRVDIPGGAFMEAVAQVQGGMTTSTFSATYTDGSDVLNMDTTSVGWSYQMGVAIRPGYAFTSDFGVFAQFGLYHHASADDHSGDVALNGYKIGTVAVDRSDSGIGFGMGLGVSGRF